MGAFFDAGIATCGIAATVERLHHTGHTLLRFVMVQDM